MPKETYRHTGAKEAARRISPSRAHAARNTLRSVAPLRAKARRTRIEHAHQEGQGTARGRSNTHACMHARTHARAHTHILSMSPSYSHREIHTYIYITYILAYILTYSDLYYTYSTCLVNTVWRPIARTWRPALGFSVSSFGAGGWCFLPGDGASSCGVSAPERGVVMGVSRSPV